MLIVALVYWWRFAVPGAPSAVKALMTNADSILVSWKPPEMPNGVINQYTVYIKEGGEEARSQKVAAYQLNYEVDGLKKKERYNFWVTASTNIGEGEPSKIVTISPGSKGQRRPTLAVDRRFLGPVLLSS